MSSYSDDLKTEYSLALLILAGLIPAVLYLRSVVLSRSNLQPQPQPRSRCYRILGISSDTSREALQQDIASVCSLNSAASLRLTLARSSQIFSTATITVPEGIYAKLPAQKYATDSTFLGITPLHDGQDSVIE